MPSEESNSTRPVTVAIPTYNRGEIVLDTVNMLRELRPAPDEILIVDQSENHPNDVAQSLRELDAAHSIRWIQRDVPSITKAMNHALREASNELILFLDDDIKPYPGLIEQHYKNYSDPSVHAVVGQVLQPEESPADVSFEESGTGLNEGLGFPFYSTQKTDVNNVMAGNLSVRVSCALNIEGFDENFKFVAYRFETDFARRMTKAGYRIVYEPEAGIHHLRIRTGGTRNRANHLTSPLPDHSVGDYYYALKHGGRFEAFAYCSKRFVRSFSTRFHLRNPWHIPSVMIGELRGFVMACSLVRKASRSRAEEKVSDETQMMPSNSISKAPEFRETVQAGEAD